MTEAEAIAWAEEAANINARFQVARLRGDSKDIARIARELAASFTRFAEMLEAEEGK